MVHQDEIRLETTGHRDIHEITSDVKKTVQRSDVSTGTVHIFNIGSTGTIGTIEFEPGLEIDYPEMLDRLIPQGKEYKHEETWHDGNGHSHLQATLAGAGLTIPVNNGGLLLGTWQQIFHLECDVKPRSRRIIITVHGE